TLVSPQLSRGASFVPSIGPLRKPWLIVVSRATTSPLCDAVVVSRSTVEEHLYRRRFFLLFAVSSAATSLKEARKEKGISACCVAQCIPFLSHLVSRDGLFSFPF